MSRKTELAAKIDAALIATAPRNPDRLARVVAAINASLSSTIGVRAAYSVCLDDLRLFCRLGEFEINPLMCGPVGAMFGAIRVAVFAGIGPSRRPWEPSMPEDYTPPTVLHMRYEYRYTHPDGGSNGYTLNQEHTIPE